MQSTGFGEIVRLLGGAPLNRPAHDLEIQGVVFTGRHSLRNSIFVAVTGTVADGHDFIEQALENGAAAVVVSRAEALPAGVPGIVVPDTRLALSRLAAYYSGHASRDLVNIGVTGTNGKTTVNWMIYQILNALGMPCVRMGTLGIKAEGLFDSPGNLTTPDPVQIHDALALARDNGFRSSVMETSSHALHQSRVADVEFDCAVFTNLTRDHLDYHGDMEEYFAAKMLLVENVARFAKPSRAAVINVDDEYGQRMAARARDLGLADFGFGRSASARVRIVEERQTIRESVVTLELDGKQIEVRSGFIGAHNASNIAAALAACVSVGLPLEDVARTFLSMPQVPGRLQSVGSGQAAVFVDYAHTPDALEHALKTLKDLKTGKLWALFGCGGDRDKGKRPIMAEVAARYADEVVVTSDNPRSEDPMAIIGDILASGITARLVEPDRRAAIFKAVENLASGDILLIAGKGHEDYQIIAGRKHHFSDVEEAEKALQASGK